MFTFNHFSNSPRKFTPTDKDGIGGTTSRLVEECSGDWSWKPRRDKALGENFKTFRGVPQRGHR